LAIAASRSVPAMPVAERLEAAKAPAPLVHPRLGAGPARALSRTRDTVNVGWLNPSSGRAFFRESLSPSPVAKCPPLLAEVQHETQNGSERGRLDCRACNRPACNCTDTASADDTKRAAGSATETSHGPDLGAGREDHSGKGLDRPDSPRPGQSQNRN